MISLSPRRLAACGRVGCSRDRRELPSRTSFRVYTLAAWGGKPAVLVAAGLLLLVAQALKAIGWGRLFAPCERPPGARARRGQRRRRSDWDHPPGPVRRRDACRGGSSRVSCSRSSLRKLRHERAPAQRSSRYADRGPPVTAPDEEEAAAAVAPR